MERSEKAGANGRSAAAAESGSGPDFGPAIAELKSLDIDGLRQRWRKLHRTAVPAHLPRWLLFRILAYKIQADVMGDLDRETARYLDQVADDRERRRAAGEIRSGKKPPPVPPVPPPRGLKPGAVLVREHNKVLHHVMVVQDGFSWNGSTYRSLSEVAFAMTGTKWNGPRFFGLRSVSKPGGSSTGREARR